MRLIHMLRTLVLSSIFLLCSAGICFGEELVMQVMNVGQADAILISTAGKRVLIDAGETKTQALELLQAKGIKNIDLVVATHPHADHIGGMLEVMNNINIKVYIDNGFPHTTVMYNNLMEAAEMRVNAQQMRYMVARPGQRLNFGPEAYFEVLSPTNEGFTNTRSDINSNSVILRLQHGNVCFALLGDAEAETETFVKDKLANCQIYKVSHHGSNYSSTDAMLDVMKPEVALISTGLGNKHGHPGAETLERFEKRNIKVYRTDLMGELTVVSDGKTYRVTTEHETLELTKININLADKKGLMELPGVGEKTANAIIAYREANGPYKDVNDVMKIDPKLEKRMTKILPFITIEGGSTTGLTSGTAPSAPAVAVVPPAQAPSAPALPPGYMACVPVAAGAPIPAGAVMVPVNSQQIFPQGMIPAQAPVQAAASANGKVNINTADVNALATMPGMSANKAKLTVEYRSTAGPFKSCQDLTKVKGIGQKTVDKLLSVCTVN